MAGSSFGKMPGQGNHLAFSSLYPDGIWNFIKKSGGGF
jgi:hypothetical protein